MFGQEKSLDQRYQENENHLADLEKKLKDSNVQAEQLMTIMGVEKGEAQKHVDNPDNFTEEEWQGVQMLQKALDKRLSDELKNVPNIKRTERAFKELGLAGPNWLRT